MHRADLAEPRHEAAALTRPPRQEYITKHEREEGIMRVIAGPEKKPAAVREGTPDHGVPRDVPRAVGHFLPNGDPVPRSRLSSRARALGYNHLEDVGVQVPDDAAALMDRWRDSRAPRRRDLVFDEFTTRRGNDIEGHQTAISKNMSCAGQ